MCLYFVYLHIALCVNINAHIFECIFVCLCLRNIKIRHTVNCIFKVSMIHICVSSIAGLLNVRCFAAEIASLTRRYTVP